MADKCELQIVTRTDTITWAGRIRDAADFRRTLNELGNAHRIRFDDVLSLTFKRVEDGR